MLFAWRTLMLAARCTMTNLSVGSRSRWQTNLRTPAPCTRPAQRNPRSACATGDSRGSDRRRSPRQLRKRLHLRRGRALLEFQERHHWRRIELFAPAQKLQLNQELRFEQFATHFADQR